MWSGLSFIAALAVHEGFHWLAAHVFFREGIRIFFLPWGFRGAWERFQPDKWTQCIICSFGPAGNFLIAAIIALIPGRGTLIDGFVKANLFIGFFNLIPLYPMDGGSILLVLLYHRIGSNQTLRIMKQIGLGIRILLILSGLYILIAYKNPSLFITIALLPGIQSIKRSVSRLNLNALIRRRERILKKRAYPVRHILILKDVRLGEALLRLDYDQYHILHVADKNLKILAQITEQQLIDTIISQNSGRTFEEAFDLVE